jgi:hypothetical protein
MKFYELLDRYSNVEILNSLNKHYPDIDNDSYLQALNELRDLGPSKEIQDIKICVEYQKDDFEDDGEEYLCCDGIGPDPDENNEMTRWALEYDDWEEWLAKDINKESLEKLDEITIVAAILWELTFNGYSQKRLVEKRNKLEERLHEADNPDNWTTINPEDFNI